MTKWDDLIENEELKKISKYKKSGYEKRYIEKNQISEYIEKGWEIVKENKNTASMQKKKRIGDAFEDEIWTLFYNMGFKIMNKSRNFEISYSDSNPNLTKQIDVIAIDDEVVILVECKESEKMNSSTTWKKELESINGYKSKLFNELKKRFPNKKYIYIFATKNYIIGQVDRERMDDFKIVNFEYDTVLYFSQLSAHLGSSARFQLLASLFPNTKINGLDNKIPAIQGKMGGLTYYSFSIEPEKLLKIAYVLHRNNTNRDNMPTYQRIIKKDRLKSVREYISSGGYFPNSLIISIDTRGKGVKFDSSSLQVEGAISKIGVLHLPKVYKSAYIIDGQHRLYGYSDSKFASSNTIPVFAFIDLDKKSQVKMFMDINENQKAVSKGLRNTLNIDMLWDSSKYLERNNALMLDIGQKLGEDKKSPLYDRIVTGENTNTKYRCITLEYIKEAFSKSDFFNEYKANNDLKKQGTFARRTNEETEYLILPFLKNYFTLISTECEEEWNKGNEGFLAINNTIYALIKILNDITNIQLKKDNQIIVNDSKVFFESIRPMVKKMCLTINDLSEKEKMDIKNAKGGAAKNFSWRILQIALRSKEPEFTNDDLELYIKEYCNDYRTIIMNVFDEVKFSFIDRVRITFEQYGDWYNDLITSDLRKELYLAIAEKSFNEGIEQNNISFWEVVTLKTMEKIIVYRKNWSDYLQVVFENKNGKKYTKTKVLSDIKMLTTIEN
ncbi:MAG: DGQHR domain-containing protein [Bacillota bacterium]|nr:DGQHR domain-containing protein [Bacillota bacterium]